MGFAHYVDGAYREGIRYCQQALSEARESGSDELIALSSSAIGQFVSMQGYQGRAAALLKEAIPLLEQTGHEAEWFRAQGIYGVALTFMGDYVGGLAAIQRARAWAQERNALTEIVQSSFFLNAAHILAGDLPRAVEASRRVVELAEQLGDRVYIYVGSFHRSWAACRAGHHDAAAAHAAKAQAMEQELGKRPIHADHLAAVNAEIALGVGRVQEAIALAQQAVGIAQERGGIFAEGLARRAWGQALAALAPPRWEEAKAQLAESMRLLEEGDSHLEAARTHVAWGIVCRDRGDLTAARAHWEQAAAQWEVSGLAHELKRTQVLIEGLQPAQTTRPVGDGAS
jgi:tetratricopeptide (TPR) repeat protein